MQKWRKGVIADLGRVVTGKTPSTKNNEFWSGNWHFITPKDLQGEKRIFKTERFVTDEGLKCVKGAILPPNAVCVSCIGNIGYVGMTTRRCVSNQQINSIVASETNDPHFIYYLMRNLWKFFKNYEGQSTVVSILNKTQFSKIEIQIPDAETQRKIAAILSALDDKIELNRRINANLEQQAAAIYSAMFTENDSLKTTSGVLSDIAVVTMGQSPKGDSYNEDGVGEVFYQGRAEFGFRFPTRRLFTTEPKRIAEKDDVLLSVRAPVGDINVAYERCCIGRGLASIRSKGEVSSYLLYTMFALKPKLEVFNGEGTVFGSVNRDALNSTPISIPEISKIKEFETLVSPIDDLIRTNYEETRRLQTLRDALLPRLMSGEIDVSCLNI